MGTFSIVSEIVYFFACGQPAFLPLLNRKPDLCGLRHTIKHYRPKTTDPIALLHMVSYYQFNMSEMVILFNGFLRENLAPCIPPKFQQFHPGKNEVGSPVAPWLYDC